MAELSGGSSVLDTTCSVAGVRDLLPYELQLCEIVGITPEEYLHFQRLSDAYDGKRAEEYEHLPDVQNGFLVPIIINLVIGVALSAIGALLAPKPRTPEATKQDAPPQLQTADVTGAKRFTANTAFDSIQELASLGETVPLVFTNRFGDVGGIRVKTLLLWSQLLSEEIGQQLKAVLLLSSGQLAAAPDFAGYAIGDQTLKNYTNAKVGLYRQLNGGRFTESDRYPEGTIAASPSADVFSIYDDGSDSYQPWFSGTRSPSTQTQFGCFNPMPNGTPYRLQYELVQIGDAIEGPARDDSQRKRQKLARDYAMRAGITASSATSCTYTITGGQEDPNAYPPWGLTDVNSAVEDLRASADEQINLGSLYMAGTAQAVCTTISSREVWNLGTAKTFTFKVEEPGDIPQFNPEGTDNKPYGMVLQRLAVATIANNRKCDITEIGIKSTVWKQLNGFPNVNSQPGPETLNYYQTKNGNIQLGTIQRYHKRLSFFKLQVRKLGSSGMAWTALDGGNLFCVKGRTPQPHYNFIRINHPREQYEFRLVPYPGGGVYKYWRNKSVYVLGGLTLQRFSRDGFVVSFNGTLRRLTISELSNPDWIVGNAPPDLGEVEELHPSSAGGIKPTYTTTVRTPERFNDSSRWIERFRWESGVWMIWDGVVTSAPAGSVSGGDGLRRGGLVNIDNLNNQINYTIYREYLDTRVEDPASSGTVPTTGGTGSGLTVVVTRWSNGYMEFAVAEKGKGYQSGDQVSLSYQGTTYALTIKTNDRIYEGAGQDWHQYGANLNPYDAIADLPKYDAENTSHMDGPEHEVVYVNEQLIQQPPNYDDLAVLGLRLNASKEWSSFAQLSAYVQKGIVVERLLDDSGNPTSGLRGPTNNLAEIVYALLTDDKLGAGHVIGKAAVNRDRMTLAARFCRANGFTWDGVVASRLNLRDWIFEQAGYCLLDFTVLGGQFSLVPSVPYRSDFNIANSAKVPISALFTDGNIRNLKVTWLSPEERQLFKAVVKWRQEKLNGFSQERMFTMRFSDSQGGRDDDPEEQFDLTGFCTTQQQGLTFAKYALKLRKEIDHGLTFETTPQAAMGLEPGQYFRLVSEVTHTSRFNNGVISSDGLVISTSGLGDGNHQILYWKPGTTEVQEATLTVAGGTAQQDSLRGTVFTLANSTTTSKTYKVETISYGEGGFVEVAGSYQPVTATGALTTLQWGDGDYFIEAG
jgi:hypothetical protein